MYARRKIMHQILDEIVAKDTGALKHVELPPPPVETRRSSPSRQLADCPVSRSDPASEHGYPQFLCTTRCPASGTRGMVTLPPDIQEPTVPNLARCPICNETALSVVKRLRDHIQIADYICPNEHLWETKWVRPTVPIKPREAS